MNAFPDTYQEAIAAMLADGLIAESLIPDDRWHRCQVDKGYRNQDGSYKVRNSENPVVFWSNWSWGTSGHWCARARSKMSREERRELEAEIAKLREDDRREREAAQAEAARVACAIWKEAKPAPENHGYLKRKEVNPGPCRLAPDGRLVMPVYDGKGEIVSLQFIAPQKREGCLDKYLLKDGRKKGCYCPIPAKDTEADGPLLIAEGFATAMSLHMATGLEVWIAIDCHNLLEVAKLARSRYAARKIGICADYDPPHLPNFPGKGGIGAAMGRKAAEAIGGYYALCPLFEGRDKADFNDLACELGLQRVQSEIEAALNGRAVTDCIIPDDFTLKPEGPEAGLYWKQPLPGGLTREVRIGDPLKILGYTRTGEGDNWGLLLAWHDMDGREHELALGASEISNKHSDWLSMLTYGGWRCISEYKKQIARYLETAKPVKRIRCVETTGWSDDRYVLPDQIYGNGADQIVLQAIGYKDLYQSKGNLEGWQELAGLCVGNPKLGFAVSCAFAGPLLKLAGMEGGLFSFEGGSSCGKTTSLTAAASVWGRPEFHVKKWRTTDNALEGTASFCNDNLLILDELGEADARKLAESVYMLSGGQGKNRADRNGGLRKTYRWNTITLSSGELGLGDKLMEAGKQTRGGLEARFVSIPVRMNDITDLHGMGDSELLVRQIRKLAENHYGVAGRAFLERLTQAETLQAARTTLQGELEDIADSFCPKGCDGQVRRVALRFALVSMAGELAREMGILPADFEAADYARACFAEWLEQRGGIGPAEDMAILNQVQLFIEQHGQSRFQDIYDTTGTCPNRVGFRECKEDGITYYCLPQAFKAEVIKGHAAKRAVETLDAAGWLRKRGNRYQLYKRLPDYGPKWVYELRLPKAREEEEG